MFGLSGASADTAGSIILYLASSLSSAGGVGGGALNVPVLYFIWGFPYSEAVILSLATLMGNYLLQVLVNIPERHPIDLTRPLIYWDAILVLLPAELGGANIGVLLSKVFPTSLDLILGLLVLTLAGTAAMEKGIDQYNKETMIMMNDRETTPLLHDRGSDEPALPELGPDDKWPGDTKKTADSKQGKSGTDNEQQTPLLTESALQDFDHAARRRHGHGHETSNTDEDAKDGDGKDTKALKSKRSYGSNVKKPPSLTLASGEDVYDLSGNETNANMNKGAKQPLPPIEYPWFVITVILVVWLLYAALYISMNDVTACSWVYWTLLSSIYPLLAVEVVWGTFYLQEKQDNDRMVGKFVKGDINWQEFTFLIPLFAFVVGILSALLGIGGGELMGPMLLNLNVLPTVSPATTSAMSFLNTSSSFLHYLTLGDVPYAYAAWVFGIGAAGGKRLQRLSI
jgi:uncharacterized membrane protein YfcA